MAQIIRRLWLLIIWTVFIWVSRIRNLINDPEVELSEKIWVFVVAGIFLLLVLVALIFLTGFLYGLSECDVNSNAV